MTRRAPIACRPSGSIRRSQGCGAHLPAAATPDNLTWDNHLSPEDPTVIVVPSPGTSAVATISVNTAGGSGAVALTAPSFGGTALVPTLTQSTITPGGTEDSDLTYTAVAGITTQMFGPIQIEGKDADGITHLIKPMISISGAAPTITSVVPATGKTQGEAAVLNGTHFGINPSVTVKGASDAVPVPVTAVRVSSTKLNLSMPGHKAEGVTLTVTNADHVSASTSYTYTAGDPPTVTAVSPQTGPFGGGTFVTITGTNFSSTSQIAIGGAPLDCAGQTDCQVQNSTTAIALTPPFQGGPSATVDITVTNADGQSGTSASAAAKFTYADNTTPPVITSLSTLTGPTIGGTYVTIYGSNFGSGAVVKFGGTTATVTTSNDSFLGVVTPPHAAGAVNVVVINPDLQSGTAAMQFTYVASAAPTITGINPSFGAPAGGDTVVITGTGFASDADVKFGGATAFVHPGNTATSLTVTTPAHAAGSVSVVVKNGDGQSAMTSFLYGVPDMAMAIQDMAIPNDLSVPPDLASGGSGGGGGGGAGGGGGGGTGGTGGGGGGGTGGTGGGGGGATDDMGAGGAGGGGGGGTGGTGGGGGSNNGGGCSATGSSNTPASALPLMGLVLVGFSLRRRTRRS